MTVIHCWYGIAKEEMEAAATVCIRVHGIRPKPDKRSAGVDTRGCPTTLLAEDRTRRRGGTIFGFLGATYSHCSVRL